MSSLVTIVRTLHGLNSWLMVLFGSASLALLLVYRLRRRVPLDPRHALRAFVGTLHLQVVLGVLTFLLLLAQKSAAFGGSSGTAWAHMGVGVLAAIVGWLALREFRRGTRPWLALLLCLLALVAVGKYLFVVGLVVLVAALAWFWPAPTTAAVP